MISCYYYCTKHWLKINACYCINVKKCKMQKKRNDIKDCTHYFLDDMIKIKNVDPNKIKIVKNSYK